MALIHGCASEPPAAPSGPSVAQPAVQKAVSEASTTPEISLVVTCDFGKTIILEQTVEINHATTALEALTEAVQVETKYGGGFVSAIDGTGAEYEKATNTKKDWFFYVNGMASNIGAGNYILQNRDVEQWDFRNWGYHQFVPAMIGAFPQPFTGGFQEKHKPTIVACEPDFTEQAKAIVEKLHNMGATGVTVKECSDLTGIDREENNLILIAGKENPLIIDLNNAYKKLGFFAYFNGEKLVVLDDAGSVVREYLNNCGLIQATQNPWNPGGIGACESVIWLISGTDIGGIHAALDKLINSPDSLRHACACVIENGEVMKIP
jgi:hypothetical protein